MLKTNTAEAQHAKPTPISPEVLEERIAEAVRQPGIRELLALSRLYQQGAAVVQASQSVIATDVVTYSSSSV